MPWEVKETGKIIEIWRFPKISRIEKWIEMDIIWKPPKTGNLSIEIWRFPNFDKGTPIADQ
jgi:hypothetical protein